LDQWEEYLGKASTYMEEARHTASPVSKLSLLELARAYLELAELTERNSHVVHPAAQWPQ